LEIEVNYKDKEMEKLEKRKSWFPHWEPWQPAGSLGWDV
jgi:hypothetical protein